MDQNMEPSPETHSLALNDEGWIQLDESGAVLMTHIATNTLVYVSISSQETADKFGLHCGAQGESSETNDTCTDKDTEILPENYTLCLDNDGGIQLDETGAVMMIHNATKTIHYISISDEQTAANFELTYMPPCKSNSESTIRNNNSSSPNTSQLGKHIANEPSNTSDNVLITKRKKADWSRGATLSLISEYDSHKDKFSSSSKANDPIWMKISKALESNEHYFTWQQCKDKFKYLKLRYHRKKDNMRLDKDSGAAFFKFDFLVEMDNIFGKKPNILPPKVSSSIEGSVDDPDNPCEDVDSSVKKQKIHMSKAEAKKQQATLDKERRHTERMDMLKMVMERSEKSVAALVDALKKDV